MSNIHTFAKRLSTMIRLSLSIPTYNRANSLLVTLHSVARQSADKALWECIVVDNNSTDKTKQVVNDFILSHPNLNIRYIFEPNQGVAYARNAGIKASRGDIISFIDDDERITSDFISAYIELFDSYPDAMAAGGRNIAEYPEGRADWISHYTEQPIAFPIDFGEHIIPFPKRATPGSGNMAVRRSTLNDVGLFNTDLGRVGNNTSGGEDFDLFERIAERGHKCYYVPKATMYHIIPASKLTKEYFCRLSYNNGATKWKRAELTRGRTKLLFGEIIRWAATLLLCFLHRPKQSYYLLLMRIKITQGILSSALSHR